MLDDLTITERSNNNIGERDWNFFIFPGIYSRDFQQNFLHTDYVLVYCPYGDHFSVVEK